MNDIHDTNSDDTKKPDPDSVLAPVSDDDLFGPDLSVADDPLFDRIQEARREDDNLPQGIWQTKRKRANWDEVRQLCREALIHRTKDLRLVVWMLEARVQNDGFSVLASGFNELTAFCQTFWSGMHPAIEENGDLSARENALFLLNIHLPQILKTCPLTYSGVATPVRYSWGDFETAQLYQSKGVQAEGAPTTDDFLASAAATPEDRFFRLSSEIHLGLSAIAELNTFLNSTCGRQAPSFEALKTLLINIQGWLHTILPEDINMDQIPDVMENASDTELPGVSAPDITSQPLRIIASQAIRNREEAYRKIAEIAEFLELTEPHSPVPYVLRRVCAWKNKSLAEILLEISDGSGNLSSVLKLFSAPNN